MADCEENSVCLYPQCKCDAVPRGLKLRALHERKAMALFREMTGLDENTMRARFIAAYRGGPDAEVREAWARTSALSTQTKEG